MEVNTQLFDQNIRWEERKKITEEKQESFK